MVRYSWEYADRIRRSRFNLIGEDYQLSINRGDHYLHDGFDGFNKKVWNLKSAEKKRRK